MKKTTLDLLSKQTGLSKTSLSRALNDCSGVDTQTRRTAKDAADWLGYVNPRKDSCAFAVILPDTPHYFWDEALKGVVDATGDVKAIRLSRVTNLHDSGAMQKCIDKAVADGALVLILPVADKKIAGLLSGYGSHITVFQLCEYQNIVNSFVFSSDGIADGKRLAQAVLSKRTAKVVLLNSNTLLSHDRAAGFCAVYPKEDILGSITIPSSTQKLMPALLARMLTDKGFTDFELLVCNDGILSSALSAIQKLGLSGKASCAGYELPDNYTKRTNRNILLTLKQDIYSESLSAAKAATHYLKTGMLPGKKNHLFESTII